MKENSWIDRKVDAIHKAACFGVSLSIGDRLKFDTVLKTPDDTTIRYVGNKLGQIQKVNFYKISPSYSLRMSTREGGFNQPVGYTAATKEYTTILKTGLNICNDSKSN